MPWNWFILPQRFIR
jgi:hypothetical protein